MESVPISELNLGDVRLRRKILRAGFKSIIDLLSLPDSDIDKAFEWDDAAAILKLKKRYEKNPEEFAQTVMGKAEAKTEAKADSAANTRAARSAIKQAPTKKPATTVTRTTIQKPTSYDGPISLPSLPFSESLQEFERRATVELDSLADQYDDVMVYQAFDEFATELDEIDEAFRALFEHYGNHPRNALSLIDRFLRNVFLIYIADRARKEYDGENLWGNLFGRAGITNGNVQGDLKRVFAQQLERRRMPLYAADEETNYYFYTALLHGGLSADSWESLWAKSLLPLAKEISKGNFGFGGEMDGHAVLKEIKNPESRFAPKKSVLNILEKAPDFTIAPLFEASLRVAAQVESAKKPASGFTMLTSYGLPDVAMQALRDNREKQANTRKDPHVRKGLKRRGESSRIVYLPEAKLQLDLSQGLVSLRWGKQQFPMHFVKNRIDYYVDGTLMLSKQFDVSVGKCILDSVEITVKPQARYNVEIKLMEMGENGEWEDRGSLEQTFTRSKPECFEFIRESSGLYRLRGKNERITRLRRVAYIVKNGFGIEPGQGMTAISEYDTSESWGDAQILLYDVEPGASGSIVNLSTREEIAVWQERYVAKIDKRRIIGETADGLDLYGFAPCGLGTNGGLPSVSIEAVDGLAALNDLDVLCFCDGKRISIPRHVLWEDDHGDMGSARVALVPSESSLFDWHIELCELEARQRSAGGKVVFRYRFAVVPIQDFKLTAIGFEFGTAVADYQFQARLALEVKNSRGEERNVSAWGRYDARTLLRDEFLNVRIASVESGKVTNAKLALAAIDVKLPERLVELSRRRPVCLADALELGPANGNVKITAFGWRYNRAAVSLMGFLPMFFKELQHPGTHSFNVFDHIDDFVQAEGSPPEERALRLSVCYGDDLSAGFLRPAWTDVDILPCKEGFGFSSWKVLAKPNGTHVLSFDAPTLHDIHLDFKRTIGGNVVGSVDISEGAAEAEIPQSVVRLLDTRKKLTITIAPTDWMGDPEYEYATSFPFSR